jgi:hypothetical protein
MSHKGLGHRHQNDDDQDSMKLNVETVGMSFNIRAQLTCAGV